MREDRKRSERDQGKAKPRRPKPKETRKKQHQSADTQLSATVRTGTPPNALDILVQGKLGKGRSELVCLSRTWPSRVTESS
jgi:hypothetical protein